MLKPSWGAVKGPCPFVNIWGQTLLYKVSKLTSTPEQRKSVEKGILAIFNESLRLDILKYSVLRIYSWQGLFELHYIANI